MIFNGRFSNVHMKMWRACNVGFNGRFPTKQRPLPKQAYENAVWGACGVGLDGRFQLTVHGLRKTAVSKNNGTSVCEYKGQQVVCNTAVNLNSQRPFQITMAQVYVSTRGNKG